MPRYFTSTILFNKTAETLGGATFMEERRSQANSSSTETSKSSDTPSPEIDPKAMFDSYMSEFQEKSTPNTESAEEDGKWNPLSSFHAYLDALEKEPDLYSLVTDGIKELRERVQFTENEYKDYDDEDFSLTAYDISLKQHDRYPENVYQASSKFDILYILLNWMQEAGVRGDCSYNEAYPLTVIQNEDTSYIWSIMIFKDGTLKECTIGDGRDNEETSINYRSIEDIQIEIADKPFQFSNYKSGSDAVKSSSDESEDKPSPEEVARRVKEVENLLRKNGSFGTENSIEEKPDFPPLTSDVIDFIDQKIKEKGGIYEIDEKEVEEIWESLNFDFALLDKNLSTEETNKWAQALVAYIQNKQS